ncbi:MAG TPA: DUF2851 family protein [Candidatus Binatia bacterium]|nr:DUF2851 family protein [Candidatus Binatia bacterium]
MSTTAAAGQETENTTSPVPISHFPLPFAEADLSRLWQDQTFPPEALTTVDGERLRVIYRGRRTGGPGPDFRDALIAAPSALLRGDVELHVRSSDFRRHGHHHDPAYAGVVLHLVFRDDDRGATVLPDGGRALVVALEGWVEGRSREIRRWLERPALWREPCLSAVARTGSTAVGATLDRLGDMRFRARTAAFARWLGAEAPHEALWGSLIEALGYGGEQETYSRVAECVPWQRLREAMLATPAAGRATVAYGLLAAAATTLPAGRGRTTRPANRPEKRLRGAAALAARFAERGAFACLAEALDATNEHEVGVGARDLKRESRAARSPWLSDVKPPSLLDAKAITALLTLLTVPGCIGRSRAVELLANAVLPCLAAVGPEGRARRAEAFYARLPLPAQYGAVRHLHEAAGRAVRVDFRRQQGMLYLLRQYCTQGGCGRCPLS